MRALRLLGRGSRLAAVTLWWYAQLELGWLAIALLPGSAERRLRWRRRAMRGWCAAICRALAVRIELAGAPPGPSSLLVSNHLSYLDIPVLGSLYGAVFVSKAEVADWPLIGHLASRGGTLFVERGRKRGLPEVNAGIRAAMARGDGVVLFPEGTSSAGDEVLPFRPALLSTAAEEGLEVYAARIAYAVGPRDPPARASVCWWGDMPFLRHVLPLMTLSGIHARIAFAPRPVRGGDRKELADALWRAAVAAPDAPQGGG